MWYVSAYGQAFVVEAVFYWFRFLLLKIDRIFIEALASIERRGGVWHRFHNTLYTKLCCTYEWNIYSMRLPNHCQNNTYLSQKNVNALQKKTPEGSRSQCNERLAQNTQTDGCATEQRAFVANRNSHKTFALNAPRIRTKNSRVHLRPRSSCIARLSTDTLSQEARVAWRPDARSHPRGLVTSWRVLAYEVWTNYEVLIDDVDARYSQCECGLAHPPHAYEIYIYIDTKPCQLCQMHTETQRAQNTLLQKTG